MFEKDLNAIAKLVSGGIMERCLTVEILKIKEFGRRVCMEERFDGIKVARATRVMEGRFVVF